MNGTGRLTLFPFLLFGLFLATDPSPLRADLLTEFGASPRAIAMGNAYAALADDVWGFYHNPAGPATRPYDTLVAGYLYNQPRVKLRDADGSERIGFQESLRAGVVGFTLDTGQWLPEKFRRHLVAGMVCAFPDNLKTYVNADIQYFDALQFPVIGRVQDISVMLPGVSLQIHRKLYVGAALRVAFTADIRNINLLFDVSDIRNPAVTFKKLDINPDTEMQPLAGLLFIPWKDLRIGAVWRKGGGPVTFLGAVNVTVTGSPLGDVHLPPYEMLVMDFYNPEEIAFSVAYRLSGRVLASLEETVALWSRYDLPYDAPVPGNPFHDIFIPRAGVEIGIIKDLTARAGYSYQPSPVSTVQPLTRLLDTDQHVFATGLGYVWRAPERYITYPVVLDAYAQFTYLPERTLSTIQGMTSVWGHMINVGCSVQIRF